ncbi:hypothetical protein SAMN06265360_105146 [Haloechinothrix alba]|uniref:Uncharacterized protein n=2 Tax=Haloechinothrix alba TaxID=664784 RepID=A0A238W6F7_9PSEU|nr:hypothetical protein SAMN06265360_105146 [Haloechinothrix alba]
MHVQFDISIDLVIRGLDAHLGTTRPAEAAGDFWATSSS